MKSQEKLMERKRGKAQKKANDLEVRMKKYRYNLVISNDEKNVIMRLVNDERNRKLKSGNSAEVELLNAVLQKIVVAEPKRVGSIFCK